MFQAMHLVYRTMEKEPVPSSLPSSLIPPSKRKKSAPALPGAVAVLPGLGSGPAALKETLRSSPSLRSATPPASALGGVTPLSPSAVNLSPKHSFHSSPASTPPPVRLHKPLCSSCISMNVVSAAPSLKDFTGKYRIIEVTFHEKIYFTM